MPMSNDVLSNHASRRCHGVAETSHAALRFTRELMVGN
ncbi:hypothetical protein SAMN05192544_102629 [Paraburkholderia hospita]|nr:hypothetical protein SAMN05192544_102629 [Paraburkholderia hospita]